MEESTPHLRAAAPGPVVRTALDDWRYAAAQESLGISNDAIHAAIERALADRGAAGDLLDFGCGTAQLTMEHALTETGFVDREFSYTDVGRLPCMPSRTWQEVLGARARGLRFRDNLTVTARKPTTR